MSDEQTRSAAQNEAIYAVALAIQHVAVALERLAENRTPMHIITNGGGEISPDAVARALREAERAGGAE